MIDKSSPVHGFLSYALKTFIKPATSWTFFRFPDNTLRLSPVGQHDIQVFLPNADSFLKLSCCREWFLFFQVPLVIFSGLFLRLLEKKNDIVLMVLMKLGLFTDARNDVQFFVSNR